MNVERIAVSSKSGWPRASNLVSVDHKTFLSSYSVRSPRARQQCERFTGKYNFLANLVWEKKLELSQWITTTTTTTMDGALHGKNVGVRGLLQRLVHDILGNGSDGFFKSRLQLFQEHRPVFVQYRVHAVAYSGKRKTKHSKTKLVKRRFECRTFRVKRMRRLYN